MPFASASRPSRLPLVTSATAAPHPGRPLLFQEIMMSPWVIAAIIAAVLLAMAVLGALFWLAYVGRRTLGLMLLRIDSRGWFSIGLFALAGAIFAMLAW